MILVSLVLGPTTAAAQTWTWAQQFGTSGSDLALAVTADPAGNAIVAGVTDGAFAGQTKTGPPGTYDGFVRKVNGSGNVVWTQQFGMRNLRLSCCATEAHGVAADPAGNVIVVGESQFSTVGPISTTGVNAASAVARKYDANGSLRWSIRFGAFGGGVFTSADGVAADGFGNVYLGGWTTGPLPGQTYSGGTTGGQLFSDAFIRKLDPSGNELWTRQFGARNVFDPSFPENASISAVAVDSSANVIVAGNSSGLLAGQTSTSGAFVRKYDSNGNELWTSQQFGTGRGSTQLAGAATDRAANVYVAGSVSGPLPGQTSSSVQDLFVRKYDPSGNQIWTRQFGPVPGTAGRSRAFGQANALAVDGTGSSYVVGSVVGALPGQTYLGQRDAFTRKYDATGVESWTLQYGSPSSDEAKGVAGTASGDAYVAGQTFGSLPGQTSSGSWDAFLVKFGATAANTPVGSGVVVPLTGPPATNLTFATVTAAGNTTMTTSSTGPTPPAGFALGVPATFLDITTTATYSGSITVCVSYAGMTFISPFGPRLYHYENGTWVDTNGTVNSATQTICGAVTSLSPFALFQRIDTTPPVTTASVIPLPNAAGWNDTNVTVTLTATDDMSGVASTTATLDGAAVGTAISITTEGIHTLAYYSTDRAGNAEATHTLTIRVDKTPPTILGARTPAANGFGWNNTNVTVSFTCADALSGVAVCPAPVTITTDGANQSVAGTAVDNAGNVATATVSGINIDKTPPTITGAPDRAPNAYGWYSADVTVSFTCADALSGVVSCSGPVTLSAEAANQSAAGTAQDKAGNSAATMVSGINIDKTPPVTTATATPGANAFGWNNTDVTIGLSATDALSGVATMTFSVDGGPADTRTCSFAVGCGSLATSVAFSREGIHTLTYSSSDRAGNVEPSHTLIVRIDKTPPEAKIGFDSIGQRLGVTGADALAGIAGITSSCVAVTNPDSGEDGGDVQQGAKGQLCTYTITDRAGNPTTLTVAVKQAGNEVKASAQSIQYGAAPLTTLATNRIAAEWEFKGSGALSELSQQVSIGRGDDRSAVFAKFADGVTRIEQEPGDASVTTPGVVIIDLATNKGVLSITY